MSKGQIRYIKVKKRHKRSRRTGTRGRPRRSSGRDVELVGLSKQGVQMLSICGKVNAEARALRPASTWRVADDRAHGAVNKRVEDLRALGHGSLKILRKVSE